MVDLDSSGLFKAQTNQQLADFLGVPLKHLCMLAFSPSIVRYQTFNVPKKSGDGFRVVSSPRADLKRIQRIIAQEVQKAYPLPSCVYGFVPGRSVASNAFAHTRKRVLLKIDLVDFFPTISSSRIHGLFLKTFKLNTDLANTLTNLTCENGSLPQGAPSSPVLSNVICYAMDRSLMSYASNHHFTYTRYADDLIFSSTSQFESASLYQQDKTGIDAISTAVVSIIERNGFRINEKKIHLANRGKRQTVNGIVVNAKNNFTREQYRSIRALFHNWKTHGFEYASKRYVSFSPGYASRVSVDDRINEAKFIEHIRGRLAYLTMVVAPNKKISIPLQKLWTSFYDLTGLAVPQISPERLVCHIEAGYDIRVLKGAEPARTDVFAQNGSGFIISNLVCTCSHCVKDSKAMPVDRALIEIRLPNEPKAIIRLDDMTCYEDFDFAFAQLPDNFSPPSSYCPDLSYIPQVGENVVALGYAGGGKESIRAEAQVRSIKRMEGRPAIVEVDRAFIKGMSGGPVLNSSSRLIGYVIRGSSESSYSKDGEFILLGALAERTPFNEPMSTTLN